MFYDRFFLILCFFFLTFILSSFLLFIFFILFFPFFLFFYSFSFLGCFLSFKAIDTESDGQFKALQHFLPPGESELVQKNTFEGSWWISRKKYVFWRRIKRKRKKKERVKKKKQKKKKKKLKRKENEQKMKEKTKIFVLMVCSNWITVNFQEDKKNTATLLLDEGDIDRALRRIQDIQERAMERISPSVEPTFQTVLYERLMNSKAKESKRKEEHMKRLRRVQFREEVVCK